MANDADATLRSKIATSLAGGPRAQGGPDPETDEEFARIRAELQALVPDDVDGKVRVSGLSDHPSGPEQRRCRECMYFLMNRQWCDLPELKLPVEADWHCRLWRI